MSLAALPRGALHLRTPSAVCSAGRHAPLLGFEERGGAARMLAVVHANGGQVMGRRGRGRGICVAVCGSPERGGSGGGTWIK